MLQAALESKVHVFNKNLNKFLTDGIPQQLYAAAKHLPYAGGKRLRPVMTMLACESITNDGNKALPYAAALELVHNFTLVHDDIMDNSNLRRNLPTVHIEYGEQTAILAGDFLFAKAFEAIHKLDVTPALFQQLEYELVHCVEQICEGQQLDIEFEKRTDVTEHEYLDMITKKTAVLFRLSTRGGALIGGGTSKEVTALTTYGLNLGLGFQIWDDYLDLSSDEETLGKDIGNDIRNGKKTLIVVHALENASPQQKQLLTQVLGNPNATEKQIKQILSLFKTINSIAHAKNTAISYCTQAKDALHILKDTSAKTTLKELADYAIQREK
jgi:geranylgeranyl diphosphate synthase type I